MKQLKVVAMFFIAALTGASLTSCNNEEAFEPTVSNSKSVEVLPEVISTNKTLYANVEYQLAGKTYVADGATLTIQPGTVIKGQYNADPKKASALIITRGSKIMAKGTAEKPIVFTALNGQKGGWGGLVLLGKAVTNQGVDLDIEGIAPEEDTHGIDIQFGGTDDNDNSGVLSYVRVEYAGASISADNELNAFTFGGVGRGTQLDHLQAYYGADDAFEFFGGCVNAQYLVSTATDDDGLDFDWGYTGTIQFALVTIDAAQSYSKDPNGIECDNDATGSDETPYTHPVLSNLTIVGTQNGQVAQVGKDGKFLKSCANFRRNTQFTLVNSIVYGFPRGILKETNNDFVLENNVVCALSNAGAINFSTNKATTATFTPSATNVAVAKVADLVLNRPWGNYNTTDILPKSGPAAGDSYFVDGIEDVDYIGAISKDNPWTSGTWIK